MTAAFSQSCISPEVSTLEAPDDSVLVEEPEEPPITLEPSNLIVESIKPAEDGDGCVVRFYDSECTTSRAKLRLRLPVRRVAETNMLEDEIAELPLRDGVVERVVKPFEIVTVKLFF